jgi:hypothetical protein
VYSAEVGRIAVRIGASLLSRACHAPAYGRPIVYDGCAVPEKLATTTTSSAPA